MSPADLSRSCATDDGSLVAGAWPRPYRTGRRGGYGLATLLLAFVVLFSGCASVPPSEGAYDPIERPNRGVYRFNDELDKAVLEPVADAYVRNVPERARRSVTNFFSNIGYLDVALNNFLQGKGRRGFSDLGRILVNSTIGILGLFDPATSMGLVRHDEDFGQTLGVWGAREGAYLVLPLLGPSTVRDAPGLVVATVTNGLFYIGSAAVTLPLGVLYAIDTRARASGAFEFINRAALDPYVFTREAYRQNRIYRIYDGNPPRPEFFDEDLLDEELNEDAAEPSP